MASRRKICLASRAPFVGGAEVALERLALGLQESGHDVLLILGQGGAVRQRLEHAGLRCLVTALHFTDKRHWWRYWQSQSALRRLLGDERPDIVHANDLPSHQALSSAARKLGIPRVCHHRFFYDGAAVDWFNKFGAEGHLFVSRALMADLCAGSKRLEQSPRAVVYDGLPLPPQPSDEDRLAARRSLGLPAEPTLILFAGQIIERKGVADLLRAWSLLKSRRDGAELIVAGDDSLGGGRYRLAMEALARELSCPARFVGFQNNIPDWLRAADIAVVPSHIEPLGNATLEAMAHALPVVGCDVGGIPEMIVPEQTGLLVPPHYPEKLADALARLLADRDLRRHLGAQGRQRCQREFSIAAHVQHVLKQYEAVWDPQKHM